VDSVSTGKRKICKLSKTSRKMWIYLKPENVLGLLSAEVELTDEAERAPTLDIFIRSTRNFSMGFCKWSQSKTLSRLLELMLVRPEEGWKEKEGGVCAARNPFCRF